MTVIEDREQDSIMRFGEIEVGDFFKHHNSVFLKTNLYISEAMNAFNFSNGKECFFRQDELVKSVDATINIDPW